ncbi:AMP-binding protein [Nocardia sp. NBC_01327]|uniref:AMP-binding protein n=1 Tax=Nocardia sp. NBC_01327 TaxID=2903593 RepID=UPI002E11B2AB|nr:AMP-binding protein [Nocardia sp. NBC_01327]
MTTATYWQAIDRFRAVVADQPDREAVIFPAGTAATGLPEYRHLTYRELDTWSDTIGGHLAAAGVGRGTRTIVLVLPSPELYAIMLGLLKIGAVPVVIDPGMGLRKMLNCLRAADAEAFIGIPQAHAARVLFSRYFRDVRVKITVGPRWFWGGDTLQSWGTPCGSEATAAQLNTVTPVSSDKSGATRDVRTAAVATQSAAATDAPGAIVDQHDAEAAAGSDSEADTPATADEALTATASVDGGLGTPHAPDNVADGAAAARNTLGGKPSPAGAMSVRLHTLLESLEQNAPAGRGGAAIAKAAATADRLSPVVGSRLRTLRSTAVGARARWERRATGAGTVGAGARDTIALGTGSLADRVPAPDGELLLIAFTTGSTGPAKAVEMTHGNLSAMVDQVDAARGRVAPDTSLITLPLVGILDMLLGARCVLPPLVPSQVGSTDPAYVADAINRFGVRTMFASPAVLIPLLRYLESSKTELPTLHSIYSGGAPVPDWCIAGLREVLPADSEVHAGYGSTEALPMSTIESRELLGGLVERAHRGEGTCIGRPAEGVRARLVAITDDPIKLWSDAEAREAELVATRGIGELVVAGPNVSTRYYWPREANRAGKIIDGDTVWHRTGDLAWIDQEGRIWFCGRKSQRVHTAEGPMFSVQVEQVFNTLPGVVRTALVGVGPRGAQQPVLCVEAESGADTVLLAAQLRTRATEFAVTAPVSTFLFHPKFPVDIRHNAKIGREQLSLWATQQLGEDK